jgi:lactoylglutathione lyase
MVILRITIPQKLGGTVLEIYPLTKDQKMPDKSLRLGFSISRFDSIIEQLKNSNTVFSFEPMRTDFGFMTVIEDPDGRKIELYKE